MSIGYYTLNGNKSETTATLPRVVTRVMVRIFRDHLISLDSMRPEGTLVAETVSAASEMQQDAAEVIRCGNK